MATKVAAASRTMLTGRAWAASPRRTWTGMASSWMSARPVAASGVSTSAGLEQPGQDESERAEQLDASDALHGEPALRLPASWLASGERYGFTSTTRLPDGTWLMAYTVDRDGRYARNVPPGLAEIRWATSSDGVTFTRRGVAVNPNNRLLLGGARSPEFFGRQLYFHSLKGIFRVTWHGRGFTRRPTLESARARTRARSSRGRRRPPIRRWRALGARRCCSTAITRAGSSDQFGERVRTRAFVASLWRNGSSWGGFREVRSDLSPSTARGVRRPGRSFPRGVAVNPNNRLLLGGARSPEFFGRQLYFHSLKGIFRVTWHGRGFTRRPTLELGSCKDPGKVFPWTPPPADPTLARIGGTTMLFHGDHTRGIFRSVRRARAHACFRGVFVA